MNENWRKQGPELAGELETMKGTLLSYQQSASLEGEWIIAEKLFKLAQEVDRLCTSLVESTSSQQAETGASETQSSHAPRYEIEGNLLKRIGWSKSEKAEYLQTVTRENVKNIVENIVELSKTNENISSNDLKERLNFLPDYQIYAVIGFLLDRGLLYNPRRGIYRIVSKNDFRNEIEKLWINS